MNLIRQRAKVILIILGIGLLLVVGWSVIHFLGRNQPIGVDELWDMHREGKSLDGRVVVVRGDAFMHPQFHRLVLVGSRMELPVAYWFGVGIEELTCVVDGEVMTCQPFDPTQATAFEFKGTLHLHQMGKLTVMELSHIDFEHSHQLVDGRWQPIPIGEFELPVKAK